MTDAEIGFEGTAAPEADSAASEVAGSSGSRGRSRRAREDRAGLIRLFIFGACIFLLTSPFTFTLIHEDPNVPTLLNISNMRQSDNSQVLLYLVRAGVLAMAGLFMIPRIRALVRGLPQLLPVIPFTVWAALSILWSDDAAVSWHGVAALVALWITGFLIAQQLRPVDLARAIVVAAVIMAVTSIAYALVLPAYGIHQSTDATQNVHAGAWRGVYLHKNFLGHVSAFFAAGIFFLGKEVVPSRILKWGIFALLIFTAAMTTSASALAMVVISVAAVWGAVIASPKTRTKAIIIGAPAALALYWSVAAILEALGRDDTFSGRTVVWKLATDSFLSQPFNGFGYVAMTYGDFSYQLMRTTGLFDPHNAFFDIALGTGFIGLVLFLLILPFAWIAARRLYLAGGGEAQAALALSGIAIGWMISGMTESSDRPFTAMGGLGLFAFVALLSVPRARRQVRRSRGLRAKVNEPVQARA
ncbi:MAG: O-antigen ligase family protein [Sphingomonas sp.]